MERKVTTPRWNDILKAARTGFFWADSLDTFVRISEGVGEGLFRVETCSPSEIGRITGTRKTPEEREHILWNEDPMKGHRTIVELSLPELRPNSYGSFVVNAHGNVVY